MKRQKKNVCLIALSALCVLFGSFGVATYASEAPAYTARAEVSVPESTADFAMMNGAYVRYDTGSTGLRFVSYMTEDKYDDLLSQGDVTIGMVIMPYSYCTDYALLNEGTLFGANGAEVKYCWDGAQEGKREILNYQMNLADLQSGDGLRGAGRYFKCAISNIYGNNYERAFYAKSYYILNKTAGGTEYGFTDDNSTNIRTVDYVAKRALENTAGLSATQISVLSKFAYLGDDGSAKAGDFENGVMDGGVYSDLGKDYTLTAVNATLALAGETGEKTLSVTGSAIGSGVTVSLKNMTAGERYTFSAEIANAPALEMTVEHFKDGNVYDGVTYYTKTKEVTANGNTYTADFETAPLNFDEIRLTLKATEEGDYTAVFNSLAVTEAKTVKITGIPEKYSLTVGESVDLDAELSRLASKVTWASSNGEAATVNALGTLTAVGAGKTEITATVVEDGETYVDYFELYVLNETPSTEKSDLVSAKGLPVDFVLNVPTNKEINILQLTDTQIIDPAQTRVGVELGGTRPAYEGGEEALYGNMDLYIDRVFETLTVTPDLIVLTGDNTYGKFDDNGTMLDHLIAQMEKRGIWWTFVFGNHDKESDIGVEAMLRKYANAPHCLYAYSGAAGDSNISIAIKQGEEYKKLLFMVDTHSTGANRVDEYMSSPNVLAGVYQSQRDWMTETVETFHKDVAEVSAQLYLHIPFTAYETAVASYTLGAEIADETGENFGGYYADAKPFDEDGTFFALLKTLGVNSVFCGHEHTNSYSVVYDGVRLTYGLKTGTYDAFRHGDLGGTLITLGATDEVEHIYVVEEYAEDFDFARPFTTNNLRTPSLNVWWGEAFTSQGDDVSSRYSLTSAADELPEGGSGQALKLTLDNYNKNKYVAIEFPSVTKDKYYKLTYSIKFSTGMDEAHQSLLYINTSNNAENQFANVVRTKSGINEYTFKAPATTVETHLYIWFWDYQNGDWTTGGWLTIDNVSLVEEDAPVLGKVENTDGTFEKNAAGNISLLGPETLNNEGLWWMSTTSFQETNDPTLTPDGTDSTAMRVTSSGDDQYEAVIIKFAQKIVSGNTYQVTFDAKWHGVDNPTNFYYVFEQTEPKSDSVSWTGVAANDLFKQGATFSFTATADSDALYFWFMNNTKTVDFNFTIDNVKVTEVATRYSFGNGITLMTNNDSEITDGNASYAKSKGTVIQVEGETVRVISTNPTADRWNFCFIRFDTKVEVGKTYTITFNAEWLGDADASGFYYSFDYGTAQAQGQGYKGLTKDNLFKGSETTSITFTPTIEYGDYFYLRIVTNHGKTAFNFTIDNITLTEVTA